MKMKEIGNGSLILTALKSAAMKHTNYKQPPPKKKKKQNRFFLKHYKRHAVHICFAKSGYRRSRTCLLSSAAFSNPIHYQQPLTPYPEISTSCLYTFVMRMRISQYMLCETGCEIDCGAPTTLSVE